MMNYIDIGIVFLMFILGVGQLLLWRGQKERIQNYYIAIIAIASGFRVIYMRNVIIGDMITDISPSQFQRLELIFMLIAATHGMKFYYKYLKDILYLKMFNLFLFSSILLFPLLIFTKGNYFQYTIYAFWGYFTVLGMYASFEIYRIIKQKVELLYRVSASLILVVILLFVDIIFTYYGNQNSRFYTSLSVPFIIMLQDYIDKYRQKKQLENLDTKVSNMSESLNIKDKTITRLQYDTAEAIKQKEVIKEKLKQETKKSKAVVDVLNYIKLTQSSDNLKKQVFHINDNLESFKQKLLSKHPKITKTELEICTLTKIGKSKQEIAGIRNTSREAVKSTVSRFRKKIQLDASITLEAYLNEL